MWPACETRERKNINSVEGQKTKEKCHSQLVRNETILSFESTKVDTKNIMIGKGRGQKKEQSLCGDQPIYSKETIQAEIRKGETETKRLAKKTAFIETKFVKRIW